MKLSLCPIVVLALTTASVMPSPNAALAQSAACRSEQFDAHIDSTGAYLREFALERQPQLNRKLDALAEKKGWAPQKARENGFRLIQDQKTAELDARARKLLITMDQLSAQSETEPTCERLQQLKATTRELRTVTEAKFSHMTARADEALEDRPQKPKEDQPRTASKSAPANSDKSARQYPTKPPAKPWMTTTTVPAPPAVVLRELPPPDVVPTSTTYSVDEIREAGRGFFGNISAGLASVIQYAFKNYGAPSGYILGTEGGGAFLAGLSFGEGHLNTKIVPPKKVFWQGPSVGYDLGLTGSRVMFLIYNLKEPDQIFTRFAGIGGSAYIVGGVGLTYHKRGKIVLAPIRTGIGLRLGANIGYLKFTPRLSLNPF